MPESYTPREFINKINADNPGPVFDPYGVEGLVINQDQSPGQDILTQAKVEAAKEKAKEIAKNTPEGQVAELERQVEAMSQWLIQDATYTPEEVNNIIQSLKVEYNQETQQAEVVGYLFLSSLITADDLKLPQSIYGSLFLSSLTTAEGLTLPDSIGGNLNLGSLTTAEGLTLPTSIGGALFLNSLTTAEGLTLPTSIGGLDLYSLTSAERNEIRAQRPDLASKIYPKD